jgi:quinol monooxygenase YgiN
MYMRINYFTLKPGALDAIWAEAENFLKVNDPDETGLMYIMDTFVDDGTESVGITIWKDKEKFEASSQRWQSVMDGMAHLMDGEPRRVEQELSVHNLPLTPPSR